MHIVKFSQSVHDKVKIYYNKKKTCIIPTLNSKVPMEVLCKLAVPQIPRSTVNLTLKLVDEHVRAVKYTEKKTVFPS